MHEYDLDVSNDWLRAQALLASGEQFEAAISACNKLGLVVKFGRLRGLAPIAEITTRPPQPDGKGDWMSQMRGMKLWLKVIEADRGLRRLIFSER